jgi:hypothetical protein
MGPVLINVRRQPSPRPSVNRPTRPVSEILHELALVLHLTRRVKGDLLAIHDRPRPAVSPQEPVDTARPMARAGGTVLRRRSGRVAGGGPNRLIRLNKMVSRSQG